MDINWQDLFAFHISPLELVVRGSLVYLFLFIAFRSLLQRDVGAVGIADILVLVLIADAVQNAMAGDYKTISEGVVLASTILGWNVLLDYLAFRFPALRRALQPKELCLVRDGKILHRNLRREFLSEDELFAKLRQNGIEEVSEVRRAYLESDGTVSVIKRDKGQSEGPAAEPRRPF